MCSNFSGGGWCRNLKDGWFIPNHNPVSAPPCSTYAASGGLGGLRASRCVQHLEPGHTIIQVKGPKHCTDGGSWELRPPWITGHPPKAPCSSVVHTETPKLGYHIPFWSISLSGHIPFWSISLSGPCKCYRRALTKTEKHKDPTNQSFQNPTCLRGLGGPTTRYLPKTILATTNA